MAIFVNNLTYNDQHDFYFRHSSFQQNVYRSHWATHFLPLSTPLSIVQKGLVVAPQNVDILLKIGTMLMAFGGTIFFLATMRSLDKFTTDELIGMAGIVAATPCFMLYIRTGIANITASFFCFWVSIWWGVRYLRTNRSGYLCGLAVSTGVYGLVLYPPIVVVPIVLLLFAKTARGRQCPRPSPLHLAAAGLTAIAIYAVVQAALAVTHNISLPQYQHDITAFMRMRSEAFSTAYLDPRLAGAKLCQLLNQHLWLLHHTFGSASRSETVWTLGSPHIGWIAVIAVTLPGFVLCVRRNAPSCVLAAVVLAAHYGVFLSISTPEGRYLMTATPCYAVMIVVGCRRLFSHPTRRRFALAAACTIISTGSFSGLTGHYREYMADEWSDMAGIREAVDFILAEEGPDRNVMVNLPLRRYGDFLYFQMINNFRLVQVDEATVLAPDPPDLPGSHVPGASAAYVLRRGDMIPGSTWRQAGFQKIHAFSDRITGEQFVIMARR